MPAPALPQPWEPAEGTARLHREYRDPLGRPMSGTVTITNATRIEHGGRITPARTSVSVELVSGVLDRRLPPGTYRLTAELRSLDGAESTDVEQVTLTAP